MKFCFPGIFICMVNHGVYFLLFDKSTHHKCDVWNVNDVVWELHETKGNFILIAVLPILSSGVLICKKSLML